MMENKNKNNNQLAQLMRAPTQEDIEEAELDIAVLSPDECQVRLTEQAAEVRSLVRFHLVLCIYGIYYV